MTIFKYTMIKYLKSWSTWIILILSVFLASFGGGYLPYHFLNSNKTNAAMNYASLVMGVVAGITSFLSIFVSIFAGFKSAQMFKDEVEDGTFLIILSKPFTRGKIIFWKWVALQTLMLGFTFITSLSYLVSTAIFDNGKNISGLSIWGIKTITSQLPLVAFVIWSILTLFGLIFTSIALLLSTKLSTGTTIGISIAIGVIIPITNIVSLFTYKNEWNNISQSNIEAKKMELDIISKQFENLKNNNISIIKSQLKNEIENYKKMFDKIENDHNSLLKLAYNTNEIDGFKKAWPFDLNFHVNQISTFASDLVIPNSVNNFVYSSRSERKKSVGSQTLGRLVKKSNINSTIFDLTQNAINSVSDLRNKNWQDIKKIISLPLLDNLNSKQTKFEISGNQLESLQTFFGLDIDNMMNKIDSKSPTIYPNQDNNASLNKSYLLKTYTVNNYGIKKIMKGIIHFFSFVNTEVNNNKKIIEKSYQSLWKNDNRKKNGKVLIEIKNNNQKALNTLKKIDGEFSNFWKLSQFNENELTWNNKEVGNEYINILSDLILRIRYALNENKENEEAKAYLILFNNLQDLFHPLNSYFINSNALREVINENKILELSDSKLKILEKNNKMLGLDDNDAHLFKLLSQIYDNNPNSIAKIKIEKYVSKWSLLYFYLSLAMILVPLSYWITKKQDYR